jgi:hypothetical protein
MLVGTKKLTFLPRNLHLQHAPPIALTAFIPARASLSNGPIRPDRREEARLEERAWLESKTFSPIPALYMLAFELLLKIFEIRFRPRSLCRLLTEPDLLTGLLLWKLYPLCWAGDRGVADVKELPRDVRERGG